MYSLCIVLQLHMMILDYHYCCVNVYFVIIRLWVFKVELMLTTFILCDILIYSNASYSVTCVSKGSTF